MDELDINNPNLDGDFKALIKANKARQTEKVATPTPITFSIKEVDHSHVTEARPSQVDTLRDTLFTSAKNNDVEAVKRIARDVETLMHEQLSHNSLREADSKATALHRALEHGSTQVAEYLIASISDDHYFAAQYELTVSNMLTQKTALHILTDAGDARLMKDLLDRFVDASRRQAFLHMTTLMAVAGQRPRDFSAIHIAALLGHTDIINILVKLGVDVNLRNKKDDTAALWAARGNNIDTMRRLIDLHADVDHQNDKGSTPLYWAVRYNFVDMVRLLAKEGTANIHHRRKLGLVSPVVMAAALGYSDIVSLLLSYGADINTKITGSRTALHFAASSGLDDVVYVLLSHNAEVDTSDDTGTTPLHMAAKNSHLSTMNLLCMHNASIEARDKFGKTAWNYALETEGIGVLETVVNVYRKRSRMGGRQLLLPVDVAPLHEAARIGDANKIKYLISQGCDPHAIDVDGNTFVHIAARENKHVILKYFLDSVDINRSNNDGDISMHLAARRNHAEVVKVLIKKTKLNLTNNTGYTALHDACWSRDVHAEVVAVLVKTMVENNNWSLIDAKDHKGNTALHVAAIRNHADIIPELKPLNPCTLNSLGDNPFHAAAKKGNSEVLAAMFKIFNRPGKGLDLEQENQEGDTILHICAKVGSVELVESLIEAGADLSKRNKQGNTILHEMAEEISINPVCTGKILAVFEEVVECAPIWWCIKCDLARPDRSSDIFIEYQRRSLLFLTSDTYNLAGYNVLGYCAKLGALPLFETILNTECASLVSKGKTYVYDVTNITPDTTVERMKRKKPGMFSKSSVGVITDEDENTDVVKSSESYLDIIVDMTDEVLATQFLDITPLKQLSENLWTAYQWIYIVLMIVHIIYMSCLSAIAIPSVGVLYNTTSNVKHTSPPTVFPYILFLTWPSIMAIFQVFVFISIVRKCRRHINTNKIRDPDQSCSQGYRLSQTPGLFMFGLFNNLSTVTALSLSIFILLWYIHYVLDHRFQVYFLSVAMVLGWMLTIVFTKGFKTVHAFSTMLSYIIIRDVTRFVVIYTFVLIGFSMAMHTLFQITVSASTSYSSPWDTIFLTFNLMLGMGELFDDTFDQSYKDAGSSSVWVKIVYLFYMILATIILLNLLIAMLSDTYNEIKSREGTTWRVNSVRMALRIERWMPFLKKLAVRLSVVDIVTEFDEGDQRWLMKIPAERVKDNSEKDVSEIAKGLRRMETHMGAMQLAYDGIQNRIDDIVTKLQPPGTDINQQVDTDVNHRSRSRSALKTRRSTQMLLSGATH